MAQHAAQTAARQRTEGAAGARQLREAPVPQNVRPDHGLYELQKALGNQVMQRTLMAGHAGVPGLQRKCTSCQRDSNDDMSGLLQTKLAVNQPGDVFEQEAERVAEAVMSRSWSTPRDLPEESEPVRVHGACSCGGKCEECQRKAVVVQRASAASASGSAIAPPIVHEALRSAGQPLDGRTRSFMESGFGADFGVVRVHTDDKAAESAQAVNALAFTVGRQIVFARGQYSPHSARGRLLLSHELAHVLQQDGAAAFSLQRTCGVKDIADKVGDRGQCTDKFDRTFLSGLPLFKFNVECDTFAAGEDTKLTSFVAGLPAATSLEIHGFASSDGDKKFNENLGCARAVAAFSLLTTPAPPGFAGILSSRITAVINHGPVRSSKESTSNLRSVVIRTSGGPGPKPVPPSPPAPASLQTVTLPAHIRGVATPGAMTQDRIPPRVDTPVDITFGGTPDFSSPVELSIDGKGGGNGSATINGSPSFSFALAGTETVKLRGVDQTDVGKAGNLTLIARQHGTLLAESKGFSVSSIPQNLSFTFDRLITPADCTGLGLTGCRGIVVDYAWESDSTVQADLDRASQSERIQTMVATGIFAGATSKTGCYLSSTAVQNDTHGAGGLAGVSAPGTSKVDQSFMFKDDRTGASEIPMTNSGFEISQVVAAKPGSGLLGFFQDFQVTTSKISKATSVTDPNTACPSGTIASSAGTGSVTKTEDV